MGMDGIKTWTECVYENMSKATLSNLKFQRQMKEIKQTQPRGTLLLNNYRRGEHTI